MKTNQSLIRNLLSERGIELLEQGFVIPVLLLISVTAVDISNLFRSYNAISSAAEITARELARTDRGGAKVSEDTLSRSCSWKKFELDTNGNYVKANNIKGYTNCDSAPGDCGSNPFANCSRVFDQFGSGGSAPKFSFDYPKAIEAKGKKELEHLIPGVKFDCEKHGCAKFAPSIVTSLNDDAPSLNLGQTQFLKVQITYKQSLLWLLKHPINLSYTAEERLQTDLIDRRVFMPNGCIKGMDCTNAKS